MFFPSSSVSSYCDQQSAKIPSWKEGNVNSSSFQTSNNFVFVREWNIKFLILGELSLTVFRVQRKSLLNLAIWASWCQHILAQTSFQLASKPFWSARNTFMWHWSADTLFDSCQLTITWMAIRMFTIKLNTDCICLGYLVSNAQSLQENNACLASNQNTHTILYPHNNKFQWFIVFD